MRAALKPILFVTGHAPDDRLGPFACLHEREGVEFALFGGRLRHGVSPVRDADLPFPHRRVRQSQPLALATSGRYRAVVCGTAERLAVPAAWAGARAARLPFLLWTALWSHPRTAAHALSYIALRRLYAHADAVVTYGEHVSAYVRARGAHNVHIAPQAVDNAFWGARADAPAHGAWPPGTRVRFLFVGRAAREKGVGVLLAAWRASGLAAPAAALVLVGVGSTPPWVSSGGAVALSEAATASDRALDEASVRAIGPLPAHELRNFYAAADVLVVPSIATSTFREPWGLVVNEAMNQRAAIIATDAVGAVAGGLVRDQSNGIVVPSGDSAALGRALRRLADDRALCARLGQSGTHDVRPLTAEAWAAGFSAALSSVGCSREALLA